MNKFIEYSKLVFFCLFWKNPKQIFLFASHSIAFPLFACFYILSGNLVWFFSCYIILALCKNQLLIQLFCLELLLCKFCIFTPNNIASEHRDYKKDDIQTATTETNSFLKRNRKQTTTTTTTELCFLHQNPFKILLFGNLFFKSSKKLKKFLSFQSFFRWKLFKDWILSFPI